MNNKYRDLILQACKYIFGETSEATSTILVNTFYTIIGMFATLIFTFPYNILSARFLGPTELGKYALIQSFSMFLYIPMIMGYNTATVKYVSETNDNKRKAIIISSALMLIVLLMVISVISYYIFSKDICGFFNIDLYLFNLSIILACFLVLYLITTSILKGLFELRFLAYLQPVFALITLLLFLVFISFKVYSFKAMTYPLAISYVIISTIIIVKKRDYIKVSFDKSIIKLLSKYAILALIGGVSFIIYTNTDKMLLNKYLTLADVGIYSAYYSLSSSFMGLITGVFSTVLFPYASKSKNKKIIFQKINKAVPLLVMIGIPTVCLWEIAMLKLYGIKYPIIIPLVALFSISCVLMVWYSLYDWFFCSEGTNGVKLINISSISIAILNVIFNFILTQRYGLYGAISSNIIAFVFGIILIFRLGRKLLK